MKDLASGKVVVQSVERSLEILDLFRNESSLSLKSIAAKMGLAKSTVYGLAATLEKHNYLEQDTTSGEYRLGRVLLVLGMRVSERLNVRREAIEIMHELVAKLDETVQICVLDENKMLYIDRVEAPNGLKYSLRVGYKVHAHCSAAGKAMLAGLSDDEVEALYGSEQLPAYTGLSITSLAQLKSHLAEVREKGYACDIEESEIGVVAIGAGIRNHLGKMIAGITVVAPAARLPEDKRPIFIAAVKSAALRISKRLGCE